MKVWEKAHQLALALYPVTASFPRQEVYGLASQIRRAVSSIPSNIAEGCGRDGDREFARFCIIARGSASELEYQLLLARDLKLIQPEDYEELSAQTVEIKRMLTVLVQKLTADCARQPHPQLWLRPPAALGVSRFKQGAASTSGEFFRISRVRAIDNVV